MPGIYQLDACSNMASCNPPGLQWWRLFTKKSLESQKTHPPPGTWEWGRNGAYRDPRDKKIPRMLKNSHGNPHFLWFLGDITDMTRILKA